MSELFNVDILTHPTRTVGSAESPPIREFPSRKEYCISSPIYEISICPRFRFYLDSDIGKGKKYGSQIAEIGIGISNVLALLEPFLIHWAIRLHRLVSLDLVKLETKGLIIEYILQLHYLWMSYHRRIRLEENTQRGGGYDFVALMQFQDKIEIVNRLVVPNAKNPLCQMGREHSKRFLHKTSVKDQRAVLGMKPDDANRWEALDNSGVTVKRKIALHSLATIRHHTTFLYEGKHRQDPPESEDASSHEEDTEGATDIALEMELDMDEIQTLEDVFATPSKGGKSTGKKTPWRHVKHEDN
jgi:hypothetical protein